MMRTELSTLVLGDPSRLGVFIIVHASGISVETLKGDHCVRQSIPPNLRVQHR